jgi:hypothetical protein
MPTRSLPHGSSTAPSTVAVISTSRDVLDGELTADAVVAALDVLDPRRGEPDLRIALGVEELRRPQVRVALGAAGVDARDLGPAGDQRVRGVLLGGIESPPNSRKWP